MQVNKGLFTVNSISEISWERACSTFAVALNLKGGGSAELKGPCPRCGGDDRFWMKRGNKQPVIFACRMGCDFQQLVKEFEDRGLIEREHISRDEIQRRRFQAKVSPEAYIFAWFVVGICSEDDEHPPELDAARDLIARAEMVGIQPIPMEWVWDTAKLREEGLLREFN